MRHILVEKTRPVSSVAWFKLAEVIMRGEKERALSIHRLLMHSVQQEAIKIQLEGDILAMFNDANAVHVYAKAAALYQRENDTMQAMLLYEQVIGMLVMQDEYEQADNFISTLCLSAMQKAKLYEKLVMDMIISHKAKNRSLLEKYTANALTTHLCNDAIDFSPEASRFLAKVAALDEELHLYACELMSAS